MILELGARDLSLWLWDLGPWRLTREHRIRGFKPLGFDFVFREWGLTKRPS